MPCDYRKYPKNWKSEIRPTILARDGHKCKWCGVADGKVRVTYKDGEYVVDAEALHQFEADIIDGHAKIAKIVLTIAHVHNPDPMDCRDENLAALCQRCHNRLDMPMRRSNAAKTLAAKVGQGALL